jgi:hypothetical protein
MFPIKAATTMIVSWLIQPGQFDPIVCIHIEILTRASIPNLCARHNDPNLANGARRVAQSCV